MAHASLEHADNERWPMALTLGDLYPSQEQFLLKGGSSAKQPQAHVSWAFALTIRTYQMRSLGMQAQGGPPQAKPQKQRQYQPLGFGLEQ